MLFRHCLQWYLLNYAMEDKEGSIRHKLADYEND